jgi:hypothetical protein
MAHVPTLHFAPHEFAHHRRASGVASIRPLRRRDCDSSRRVSCQPCAVFARESCGIECFACRLRNTIHKLGIFEVWPDNDPMRILTLIQSILATAFILFGLVTLFGIGITGLLFLVPGAVFAATAALTQDKSRGGMAVALTADVVLAYAAARKLESLLTAEATYIKLHHVGTFDYLVPSAVLVLVGIGALAVVMDWRTLRNAPWF